MCAIDLARFPLSILTKQIGYIHFDYTSCMFSVYYKTISKKLSISKEYILLFGKYL